MSATLRVRSKSLTRALSHNGTTVLTYEVRYPRFESSACAEPLRSINAGYASSARHLARSLSARLYPLAVEDYRFSQQEGFPFRPYQALRSFEVPYARNCLASLYLDQYEFTGGAHGTTVRTSDTWDLGRARRLPLSAVFPRNPNYRADVLLEVRRQIAAQPQIYFDNAEALAEETFDENSFYLTPEALVVYYQQYDLAPYAAGMPEFRIAYGQHGAALPRCTPCT